MAKMTVYHGSYMPVEHPQIRVGRNTKDFGAMANNQINFCTKKSLQCLEYRGFEEVW